MSVRENFVWNEKLGYQDINEFGAAINLLLAGATNTVLSADPASPTNMTFWVVSDGTTYAALRARIAGSTKTIAEISLT